MDNKVFKEIDRLESEKSSILNLWQEIGEFCYPSMSNFTRYISSNNVVNKPRMIYDQTAEHSLDMFASSMMSFLCNPATKWLSFEPEDPELIGDRSAQEFTDEAQEKVLAVFNNPRNKFYDNVFTALKITGAFGVSPFLVEEDEDTVAKFKCESPKHYNFTEDFSGNIKAHYFNKQFTVDVLLEKKLEGWQIPIEYDQKNPDEKVDVIRKIFLNPDYDEAKLGVKFAKYISHYYLKKEKVKVFEDFFNESPIATFRWDRIQDEKWSDSPARVALADVKMLNATQQGVIIGMDKILRPAKVVSSEAKFGKLDLSADAVNVARGSIANAIQKIDDVGNVPTVIEWQELVRQSIRTAFFIDVFQTAQQVDMTATEAAIRQQEKLRNIGPKISRLQTEIGIIAERVLYLLIKQGRIKVPENLKDKNVKIAYFSPLTSAYRSGEATSILQYVQDVTALAQLQIQMTGQSALADKIDFDVLADELADIRGIKAKAIRPDKEVEADREAKAQTQATQNQLANAQQISQIAKNIPQQSTLQ